MSQLTMKIRRDAVDLLHKASGVHEALGHIYAAGGIETDYLQTAFDMREVAELLQECEAVE